MNRTRSTPFERGALARAALALLAALLLATAFAATDRRDLDLSGVRNLDASNVNGSITVTVDPAATGVTVDHRGLVDYRVTVDGDTLRLEGRNRSFLCLNCQVSFDVRLPGPVAMKLRTTNGNLTVSGAMARIDAATTNGNVTTDGTGSAPLTLSTTNGRVSVQGARAEVRARTTNGSVELSDIDLPSGSHSRAQTVNGSVAVTGLTTTAALVVDGHLTHGGISVSLDGYDLSYPDTRSFRASTSGGGQATLAVETVNGSLTVRR